MYMRVIVLPSCQRAAKRSARSQLRVGRAFLRRASIGAVVACAISTVAHAQSGTIAVTQSRVLPGTQTPPAAVVASTKRIPATGACGAARVCTPAWDLRLTGLTVDDTVVSPTGKVIARMTVENRGRVSSEASELRLCVAAGPQCVGEVAELTIPALQSGEKMEVVQPVASYAASDVSPPFTALARIDPDRISEESNRANNDASIKLRIEPAALVIDAFDVVPEVQHRASQVPVSIMVRNQSSVTPAAAATLQVTGYCNISSYRWGDSATRISIPALGPGERWSAAIAVRHPRAVTNDIYGGDVNCWLELGFSTPTDQQGERTRIARTYLLKRGAPNN
jgi:hypothetical protein